jgi:DNA modification methylase
LIEAGKRSPTDDQVARLAHILGLPGSLIALGTGRLPEDVKGAFGANAANVVAAVRQITDAQPLAIATSPVAVPLPRKEVEALTRSSIPERINAAKTSAPYRAHSYHTKVPPEAILPFIREFTQPGDLILDPFCGSGMTGVAALMAGRSALLSDLSPAAVHIARNYTTNCDPKEFRDALRRIEKAIEPTINWLYRPAGSNRIVEYTTWSDVHACPENGGRILYWDVVRTANGIDGDRVTCPICRGQHRKADLLWLGEEAVQSHTSQGSSRIDTHEPTREELALVSETDVTPIPYWTPSVSFGADREMWRAAHRAMGITSVAGFYTPRNLHALAALRHEIIHNSAGRVREALMFAFTAAVNRASRRYQWNSKRPTNVMTGTLYISSLRYEWNVWSLFRRKAADVLRYYQGFPRTSGKAEVFQRSATDLGCLPDGCVDMVFMDPPFGSNIFYADSSLLWDAWLGQLTDPTSEIVVNKHRNASEGGKSLDDYAALMKQSFSEVARVLKRGGRAVLAFSNSDDEVWSSVQQALAEAGLKSSNVHVLSKGQPSIKGVKGVAGKERVTTLDLLISLEHHKHPTPVFARITPPAGFLEQVVRGLLARDEAVAGYRTDDMYTRVIRAVIDAGYAVAGITMPAVEILCEKTGAAKENGKWVSRPDKPNDFVSGYLTPSEQLPKGGQTKVVEHVLRRVRVQGGRNSTFYLAHSYHTKLPPEAVESFIEHFTHPNDAVLDPFCGSGMTGVAASLIGRRSILNDLSPAAVHLTWNHTRPCDPTELSKSFARVEQRVASRLSELYETHDAKGRKAQISWTLWSTRHQCPECAHRFLLWEVMDRKGGRLGKTIKCPKCKEVVARSKLKTLGSQPAWVTAKDVDGRRFERAASPRDQRRALGFKRESITAWYPVTPVSSDREMFIRCALQLHGIITVADFYTPRNLEALALLWEAICNETDDRLRRALAFAFTNTAWHGTRMRRFNARGGQRPLTGTLYIPQLSSEANVLEIMRHKIDQLQRYFRAFRPHPAYLPAVRLGSATELSDVANDSVDYVFTDPPFGSNIFYADCNLIWESWLGRLTDVNSEAVVNRSLSQENGGKALREYSDLIGAAMREIARVLKPGGWATVVFHNTDAKVWQVIRDAAESAGFEFNQAVSLDRQQQSHKGYKGRSGEENVAHFDVVFNLRKSEKPSQRIVSKTSINLVQLVSEIRADQVMLKRGIQGAHAEIMRRLASSGEAAFVDYSDVRAIWERLDKEELTCIEQRISGRQQTS